MESQRFGKRRQIAIDALQAHLAQDPDRLTCFQQEAKVLALLDQHGLGTIDRLDATST